MQLTVNGTQISVFYKKSEALFRAPVFEFDYFRQVLRRQIAKTIYKSVGLCYN